MLKHLKILYKEVERFMETFLEQLIPAIAGVCIVFGLMADQLQPIWVLPAMFLISWSVVLFQASFTVWVTRRFVGVAPRRVYRKEGW